MIEENGISIPKIIHFIWAGGAKRMPVDSINVIIDWAKKNEDWQIYLWVDKETYIKDKDENIIVSDYKKDFQQQNAEVLVCNEEIDIDQQTKKPLTVIIKDIKKAWFKDDNVNYEIDRLTPNYGASSDILRYRILYEYGGAYFDSDVSSGKDKLSEQVNLAPEKHTLYVEHMTQDSEADPKQLKVFSTQHIGNDTFICTQKNPIMKKFYESAKQNYSYQGKDILYPILRAHESMRDSTIRFTGPVLVREVIKQNCIKVIDLSKYIYFLPQCFFTPDNYKQLQEEYEQNQNCIELQESCILKRVRDGNIELAKPLTNTLNWLKPKANKHSMEEVIEALKNTIIFEEKNFNILRLDCHLTDLLNQAKKLYGLKYYELEYNEEKSFNIIKNFCEEKKIKANLTQVTGKYECTIEYCEKNRLKTIFNLDSEALELAIERQLELYYIYVLSDNKLDKSVIAGICKAIAEATNPYNFFKLLSFTHIEECLQQCSEFNIEEEDLKKLIKQLKKLEADKKDLEERKSKIKEAYERLECLAQYFKKFSDKETAVSAIEQRLALILECYELYKDDNSTEDSNCYAKMVQRQKDLQNQKNQQTCVLN